MTAEIENYDLVAGHSLLDVRGDDFDLALFVGGQPIAFNWCDCKGSIAQYLARAGWTDCESELRSLRHTLEEHWLPHVPISAQIFPFLELFVPGRYQLRSLTSCPDGDYIEFDSSWDFATKFDSYYPYGTVLVATQAADSLNRDRVAHYAERIRDGHRPIALTATAADGWCEFVIDGHHKLRAYKAANVRPTFISVCRLDAPRLHPDSFNTSFGAQHPLSSHYRKMKAKHFDKPNAEPAS